MKISFVLPACYETPIGGYKVVYEYSNYLSKKGHQVTIYFYPYDQLKRFHLPEVIRRICCRFLTSQRPRWFTLHSQVRKRCVFAIDDSSIEDGEVIFATDVQTAEPVANLSESKGRKFYLIQGYENWQMSDEYVQSTYRLGLVNIVVSKWLESIVSKYSPVPPTLISNAINGDVFNVSQAIESRNPRSLIFHWRKAEHKGCVYSLSLIEKLHEKYPDFKFTAVSGEPKPEKFPSYIDYVYRATPEKIAALNNMHSIFVCTTVAEGFGLPGLEAMACGCALVSSDYQGVFDYATNEENALISPAKDVEAMFRNVQRLLSDDGLRRRIAENGRQVALRRRLEETGALLEQTICPKPEFQNSHESDGVKSKV